MDDSIFFSLPAKRRSVRADLDSYSLQPFTAPENWKNASDAAVGNNVHNTWHGCNQSLDIQMWQEYLMPALTKTPTRPDE
jgi:hypothetical protein